MHLLPFILGLALQAPSGAPSVALYDSCDASSEVVAHVARDAAFDVRYSIAEMATCYYVAVSIDGKTIHGFVLDRQIPAAIAFERARVENEQEAFKAPLPLPTSEAAAAKPEPEKTEVAKAKEEKKPVVKPRKDVSM